MTKPELKFNCFKIVAHHNLYSRQNECSNSCVEKTIYSANILYNWIMDNTNDFDVFNSKVLTEKIK